MNDFITGVGCVVLICTGAFVGVILLDSCYVNSIHSVMGALIVVANCYLWGFIVWGWVESMS